MTDKLSVYDLRWLREIAIADGNAERRIPQSTLAKLLKFGLVESRDMLTLRISRRGWKYLNIVAPKRAGRSIPYAVVTNSHAIANLRADKK
jgi:hypothetical protein